MNYLVPFPVRFQLFQELKAHPSLFAKLLFKIRLGCNKKRKGALNLRPDGSFADRLRKQAVDSDAEDSEFSLIFFRHGFYLGCG